VGLKWPNDLIWRGGKLAGILIELQGDALGPTAAVIGIGINMRLPEALRRRIEQEAADLESACGCQLDRNEAAAEVLLALAAALDRFANDGFAAFHHEWVAAHVYEGQQVTVFLPDSTRETGIARGVDREGAFLLETGGRTRRFHSGEVSLRAGAQREIAA
jgi:BirA family biotin operon repressor/biotin-[acetyl-CoA-carboxylase] ligase